MDRGTRRRLPRDRTRLEMATMKPLRLLNATAVRELLPMAKCIPLMRRAFELVATGATIQPIRQGLWHPDHRGLIGWMPGYTANPEWLGVKVVTVYPGNFGTDYGSHQGMVLLFETTHGAPVAILDGREVTAIRTAAATAAATDALAGASVRTLGILGYGEQAAVHVEALLEVRRFDTVIVWGRDLERARRFAAEMSELHGARVSAVAEAHAAADCDVVCTLTAAAEPILLAEWLRPGQHLNVVGSSIPTTSEVDEATIARGRLFVDFKDSALALAGDFRRAKAKGLVDDGHILGCVGDVLLGRVPARVSPGDITIFKSLGMASEDLIACDFVLNEAIRRNVGEVIQW
jgi:ornithine cyclodeaminase/alanine dehydrogenase-like protein (mu-crystallin family)